MNPRDSGVCLSPQFLQSRTGRTMLLWEHSPCRIINLRGQRPSRKTARGACITPESENTRCGETIERSNDRLTCQVSEHSIDNMFQSWAFRSERTITGHHRHAPGPSQAVLDEKSRMETASVIHAIRKWKQNPSAKHDREEASPRTDVASG